MTHTDAPALPDVEIREDFARDLFGTLPWVEASIPAAMTTAQRELIAADTALGEALDTANGTATLSGQLALDLSEILQMGRYLTSSIGQNYELANYRAQIIEAICRAGE